MNNKYITFKKKELKLNEEKNSYVSSSSDNISSLSTDLSKAKNENPTDNTFIVNTKSYNNNSQDNPITLDVAGKNPTDAANKYQQLTKNPNVKSLINKGNVNAKIHLQNENKYVTFSKKELQEINERL